MIKNPSANAGDIRDTRWVPGWEGSLEKVLATYSSILAWRNPVDRQQRSLTGNRPWGRKELDTTEATEQASRSLYGLLPFTRDGL